MTRVVAALALLVFLFTPRVWAQSTGQAQTTSAPTSVTAETTTSGPQTSEAEPDGPVQGSNEWAAWTQGGYPIKFFRHDPLAHIWVSGVSYGRVITDEHGPGLLRGRLEWGIDFVPVIEVLLPHYDVYGAGFTPFKWKWDFITRKRISPYFEVSAGADFSDREIVPGSTNFNFTPSGALGATFPWGHSHNYFLSADVRWYHISNAGITIVNPGLNTMELRLGFGYFSHPK